MRNFEIISFTPPFYGVYGQLPNLCNEHCQTKSNLLNYHPQGNPAGWFNRTLLQILWTLRDKEKKQMERAVATDGPCLQCTRHEATGYSPFYLLYSCHRCLPVDLLFGLAAEEIAMSPREYAEQRAVRMKQAYKLLCTDTIQVLKENNIMIVMWKQWLFSQVTVY